MRNSIDNGKKVQVPKRTRKIKFGEHIVRSEYNEGVRRNNNRCTNRLSREMQMYEKAQKVILKDLGKETLQLHARMSSTLVTPRLDALGSPSLRMTNPFAVYGSPVIPFLKMDHPRRNQLKPLDSPTRNRDIDFSSSPRPLLVSSTLKLTTPREDEKKEKLSKNRSSTRRRSSILDVHTPTSSSPFKILLSDSRAGSVTNTIGRTTLRSDTEMSFADMMSTTNRDGRKSNSEMRSNSRMNSARSSHISFIEILKEAEERKARERERQEALIENDEYEQQQRPKTPKPMSNYDDVPEEKNREFQPKSTHMGATPKATFVKIPTS